MKIFEQRPLSLILCMMLGGFFLFALSDTVLRIALISVLALILFALAVFRYFLNKSIKRRYFIAVLLTFLSMLLSYLYFDAWFFADRRFDEECNVTAVVTDIEHVSKYGTTAEIRTENIDGAPLSRYKMRLEISANGNELRIGDRIRFEARLSGFESEDGYMPYEYPKGYSAVATAYSFERLDEGRKIGKISLLIHAIRDTIGKYMTRVSGNEAGGLLFALLIGDRSMLSRLFRLDFTRLGLTHILAISGMHLAILAFILHKVLAAFHLRRGLRLLFISVFVVLYTVLTGFPSSVVRAGVMLLLSALLYALSRTKDGITTLSFAVFLIILFQPYAIFDLSLALSAFSTLGILVGVEIANERKEGKLPAILRPLVTSFLFSYLAISATLLISALRFDYISMVGIFTTPIFSLLSEGFMILGLLTLLLGWLMPVGRILTLLYRLIASLAHIISAYPVYLSIDFPILKAVIFLYTTALVLFIVCGIKHRTRFLCALVCAFIAIYASVYILNDRALKVDDILYGAEGEEERILLRSEGVTTLMDMTKASYESSLDTKRFLSEQNVSSLDYFLITQYTKSSETYVKYVLTSYKCKYLCLPEPKSEDEMALSASVSAMAGTFGVEIIEYDTKNYLTLGDMRVYFVSRSEYQEGAAVIFSIYDGEDYHTYFGGGSIDGETKTAASELFGISQSVILGCRGRAYSDGFTFDTRSYAIDLLILSDESVQIDKDVLDYYMEHRRVEYRPRSVSLIR